MVRKKIKYIFHKYIGIIHIIRIIHQLFLLNNYPAGSARTRGHEPLLVHCWIGVGDGGPALKQHRFGVSCLLGRAVVCTLCHLIFLQP